MENLLLKFQTSYKKVTKLIATQDKKIRLEENKVEGVSNRQITISP